MKKNRFLLCMLVTLSALMLSSCVFYDGYIGGKTPLGVYIPEDDVLGYDPYDKYTLTADGFFKSARHSNLIYKLKANGDVILLNTGTLYEDECLGKWEWDNAKRILNFRREFHYKKL